MKRALTISNILDAQMETMKFMGKYKKSYGEPAPTGTWLLWGESGSGKTSLAFQLAKYICNFKEVLYNSLEEGLSLTIKKAMIRESMIEVNDKMQFLDKESISDLCIRLRRQRSPDIIFIDSIQYSGIDKRLYRELKNEFHKKLFIFISHADGRKPYGRLAEFIKYDSDVKIRVEGYKGFPVSRFGGGAPHTIWHEGAEEYWCNPDKNIA